MIGFKSIADERLDFALKCVQEVIKAAELEKGDKEDPRLKLTPQARKQERLTPSEVAKNYHQYIKSFGMLMLNSGLVAALLFAQGKANKADKNGKANKKDNKAEAYSLIIKHLTSWLKTSWLKERSCASQHGKAAIKELYGKDSLHIRQATREALAFLQDLKRVADARLQKPEKTEKDGQ